MGLPGPALSTLIAVLLLLLPGTALARPSAPLGHEGRWITDSQGRVVILHGVNMVYKLPPYLPSAGGFGEEDARFLAREGFNNVRLGIIYKGLEPERGTYDDRYLARIARTEDILRRHGIFTLLDFHQDLYNERFSGEGWPDWAVQDDGLPAEPDVGFPGNYLFMPALSRAFDHFWANDPGPDGVGLQDAYASALRHVARRFRDRDYVFGYDILNEPWPGTVWPSCANPNGCPAFDQGPLADLSRRAFNRIRTVDRKKLIWYEPNLTFDFGADSHHPDTGDPRAGFTFHNYCLLSALGGAFPGQPPTEEGCDALERLVFDNADKQSDETGDALLLGEFGATDNLDEIQRIIDGADRHMVGWQYWHYCDCDDPTTAGPGVQSIVIDAKKPPVGDNVKKRKLALLARPYPQAVAGTPTDFGFDHEMKAFDLEYSAERAGGGSFGSCAQTEVMLPRRHYRDGYGVSVSGADVVSSPDATVLRLVARPGAESVSLRVTPGGPSPPRSTRCDPPLALTVSPTQAETGDLVRYSFRVTVPAGAGRRPVEGATVRFAGREARTDSEGRATIVTRIESEGTHEARATKPRMRPGSVSVRVTDPPDPPVFTG